MSSHGVKMGLSVCFGEYTDRYLSSLEVVFIGLTSFGCLMLVVGLSSFNKLGVFVIDLISVFGVWQELFSGFSCLELGLFEREGVRLERLSLDTRSVV